MRFRSMFTHRAAAALTLAFLAQLPGHADEGLWLFNDFPVEKVAKKYGFRVTQEFLDHVRLSSTRLFPYGSGSFISPKGLVFTNHHVASDCIQKLTTAEHNYLRDGFHARSFEEEKACPDLEINVLIRIEDVTRRVKGVVKPGMNPAEANRARKAEMSRIENECRQAGGDRCDVVTLFSGGQYHLYEYKKYTDVRLVFAPEEAIAAFGGDPDNFNYPRYCLDFALLRVYENGRPAHTPEYLKWSREGVKDGELTFVSGHPGTTGRMLTYAALEFYRDVSYPLVLGWIEHLERALLDFSRTSEDNQRIARDNLLMAQNSRKAYRGFLRGLRDPKLMSRKRAEEDKLRAAVNADPKLKKKYSGIWGEVAAAYRRYAEFYRRYYLLERAPTRGSDLFRIARHVVRLPVERAKPNEKRLREYTDAALPTLEQFLYSPAPIHPSMEKVVVAAYLEFLKQELGASDPVVQAALGGKSPAEAAAEYVDSSRLADVELRQRLASDAKAVAASKDGMVRLARLLDPAARKLRRRYEDEVEAVITSAASSIAQVRYAVFGADEYPDATFTLRLSYGPVKGYNDEHGRPVPSMTRIRGLYERATGKEPYKLPPSWIEAKDRLDMDTPFNFVTTNDTHGGNSGSPTINTKGEVVGILFDGNIESLPNRFVYTEERARSVHVASQAIIEALRKVYRAERILKEIGMD